ELFVIWRERLSPACFVRRIALGRLVAEEVHIVRPAVRPQDRQFRSKLLKVERRARQRTQCARIRNGNRERASLRSCHWGLNDRKLSSNKLAEGFHNHLPAHDVPKTREVVGPQ